MDIAVALLKLQDFRTAGVAKRVNSLAAALTDSCGADCEQRLLDAGTQSDILRAALAIKRASAEIDTILHAVGIALALPRILSTDERVQRLSLGAGTSNGRFDLETNYRIAEFKFIQWRGRDAQRQIGLFKDFYDLAEAETPKARYLYVLNKPRVLAFLSGKRKLSALFSKAALEQRFTSRFGERYVRVGEYFGDRQHHVTIEDLSTIFDEFTI